MFGCVNELLHSFVYLYVIVWGVVLCSLNMLWVCKWIIAFVRVFVCDCMGRGIGGLIGGENVEEPQRGDTPAKPRAQALG